MPVLRRLALRRCLSARPPPRRAGAADGASIRGLRPQSDGETPVARLRQALRGLALPGLPPASQESYRREMRAQLGLPVAFGLVEGGFVGVVAEKSFGAHPALIALITAAPMFGNLSSVLWARAAERVRKIPLLTAIQGALAGLVLAMAWLPRGPQGALLLTAAVVVARLLVGGIVTLRSLVWTLNYPGPVRARVTARLSLAATLGIAATSLLGGAWLDAEPDAFAVLYAGGAFVSCLGVAAYARIALRGEEERRAGPVGRGIDAPRTSALRTLREDPPYARYLGWQFLLGVANMMVEAPLIVLVSRELEASYAVSSALTVALPFTLGTLTLPLWAGYLDRVHVATFRARHGWLWVASLLLTGVGAWQASLAWVAAGRALLGVARGGGILAWQLGHNDFVGPERAGLYMGIHVTLTGLRGAFAPFLGTALYLGWSARPLAGGLTLPGFVGLGAGLFLLAAALSALATTGFVGLHRRLAAR